MAISNNSTGLRPGVCTSTTRPLSPYEGKMIYETDTDLTYVYNGLSWQQVSGGTAVGNSGLVYIKEITATGASIDISTGFSSTYDNYRIEISTLSSTSGTTQPLYMFMYGDGSANYIYQGWRLYGGTPTAANFSGVGGGAFILAYIGTGNPGSIVIDMQNPNKATRTFVSSQAYTYQPDIATYIAANMNGVMNTNTQYTGISITPAAGNITATVRIYGYRQS